VLCKTYWKNAPEQNGHLSPKDLNLPLYWYENSYVTGNIHIWPRYYIRDTRFTGLLLIEQRDVEVRISTDSKINTYPAWQEILWFLVTGLSDRTSLDQETPLNRVAVMNVLKPSNRTQIPLWPHRARIRYVRLQHGRNWHVLPHYTYIMRRFNTANAITRVWTRLPASSIQHMFHETVCRRSFSISFFFTLFQAIATNRFRHNPSFHSTLNVLGMKGD